VRRNAGRRLAVDAGAGSSDRSGIATAAAMAACDVRHCDLAAQATAAIARIADTKGAVTAQTAGSERIGY